MFGKVIKGLAVVGVALSCAGFSSNAGAEGPQALRTIPRPLTMAVDCQNPGSSQDIAKTPVLKNVGATTLYKGEVITWSTSDGDLGHHTLAADLPEGATVKAMGKPGQVYTCSARYTPKPDLRIEAAQIQANNLATVKFKNASPYAAAGAAAVKFEIRACSNNGLVTSAKTQPLYLDPGQVQTLTFPVGTANPGKRYIIAVADVDNAVVESNETNNVYNSQSSCLH